MDFSDGSNLTTRSSFEPGKVSWRSPSNIALIKYWGKHGDQLPQNPSLSFTLSAAHTDTTLMYAPKKGVDREVSLLFDGRPEARFQDRIAQYLQKVSRYLPFLDQMDVQIHTKNSFPHSAGIASSASGLSALALCLCTLEDQLFQSLSDDETFRLKASWLARLGSGSACRSVYSRLALWGKTGLVEGASDQYAIALSGGIDSSFINYQDAILIVDHGAKSISSTAGHGLMENHPFATQRFEQARRNLHQILSALQNGDHDQLGRIVETEALQLHAMMLSSNPYYVLFKPHTLKIIDLVREFRKTTQLPVYFTLDAGPNVHLLYPRHCKAEVESFITSVLVTYCQDGSWISDQVGEGPIEIE